ncbi:PilZ domain-containing protein [Thermodesulfobacteriota bacterium]
MDEKRKEQRTKVDWPTEVFLNGRIVEGIIKNITLNGIFVCCEEPLVLDENYRLSIFPPNHETINVVGKTLWSDSYALDSDEENAPVCIGIVFVKISTIDLDFLKDIRRFSIRNKKSAEAVHPPI